jgi:arylsulfatase A-like enzyme
MKCIRSLSSVALVSFLSLNSGVAMSKGLEQVSNPALSTQTQPVIIDQFNPFGLLRDTVRTVEQVNQIRLREQRRQEAERRRQELEAARREAAEQKRLEAQRQQQYFESLSPEKQQAYLAEQKARKAERDQAQLNLLMGIGSLLMFGGSSGGSKPAQSSYEDAPDTVCGYNTDASGNLVYNCRNR